MVDINFTLVVELILFLIFLWGTNRFILQPTMKTIDEREALIRHNEESTQHDKAEAESLETRHAQEVSHLYRETEQRFYAARRDALESRARRVEDELRQLDADVASVRETAEERVARERGEAERLAGDLAETIAQHIEAGGAA